MNEFEIKFSLNSPQQKNSNILISVPSNIDDNLLYKFLVGYNGKWGTIRDFSKENQVQWTPVEDGIYTVMVQAKKEEDAKPFSFISKAEYVIGSFEQKIIKAVTLDKQELFVGEKITAKVESEDNGVLYRYRLKHQDNWQLLKDYSIDNLITWTATKAGKQELVVQCKDIDSREVFDDFKSVEFNVKEINKLEIKDFKCLSEELLKDSELTFQVDVCHEDNRVILYKFIKIDSEGHAECLQNYSTKRVISYIEKSCGDFKLLCMVKDMYSPNEYDERAIILFNVKKYRNIKIKNFTSDITSPQICGSEINLKAVVSGGKSLLYRYVIDGNNCEDSGYINDSTYLWKPKMHGVYKITLMTKDVSFEGVYEDCTTIPFIIDEVNRDPVIIKEIISDKKTKLLVGETLNINVIAHGGTELKYSFSVKKDEKELENIMYSSCNWVNYTPEEAGSYKLEIKVKDKFSKKEFDAHAIIFIQVLDYIPANIDYVLMPSIDYYMVGDKIQLKVVCENTKKILYKYILKINEHKVEETDFVKISNYNLNPKCPGVYSIEILAKNEKSKKEYDSKKSVKLVINNSLPITNTHIECDKITPKVNESVTFSAVSDGGKEIVYEFYLMEKGEWTLVQKYSRKSYYTFIPFSVGSYKILVLCRSQINKCAYEDYSILEFHVGK